MQTRFLALGPRIGMLLVAQGRLILLFIVVIFRHGSVSHTTVILLGINDDQDQRNKWCLTQLLPINFVDIHTKVKTNGRVNVLVIIACAIKLDSSWRLMATRNFQKKWLSFLVGLYPASPTQVPNMFRKHSNRSKKTRDAFWYTDSSADLHKAFR